MRWLLFLTLVACKSSDDRPAPKPPDDMDEKMRHCPLALDGAASTLEDIAGGVRFTVKVPETAIAEVRRRSHHVAEFAATHARAGHGEFDGKGGGRMKNCPVVTDHVAITVTDIAGGAQLDIAGSPGDAASAVDALRAESRARAKKFPFPGATIAIR